MTRSTMALRSERLEERRDGFESVSSERSQVIGELLEILDNGGARATEIVEPDSTDHLALQALGVLRAAEAVQTLVRLIKVRSGPFPSGESGEILLLDADFVAVWSLIQIGSPSVRYLLDRVGASADLIETQLAVFAMVRIEGCDVARHRLNLLRNEIRLRIRSGLIQNVDRAIELAADPTALFELKS